MTVLGLRQAAQQAGVSKSTILRAIRAGRLSATRTEDGGYAIDPAELFRVYPPDVAAQRSARQGVGRGLPDGATEVSASAEVISRVAVQEAELAGAQQLIAFLRTQIDDLRSDRDGWRQQAEATQRLLAYVQEKPKPDAGRPTGIQAREQPNQTSRVERFNESDHLVKREPSEEDEQTPERAMAQIRAGLLSLVEKSATQGPPSERRRWWKRLTASFAQGRASKLQQAPTPEQNEVSPSLYGLGG